MEVYIPLLIKNLQRNNMAGFLVQDKKELLDLLRKLIADGTAVGCGDSVTLEQMGVFEDLRKRLNKATPCASLGRCIDCRHKERICNDFVLIAGQFIKDRIKVILVNEELGY